MTTAHVDVTPLCGVCCLLGLLPVLAVALRATGPRTPTEPRLRIHQLRPGEPARVVGRLRAVDPVRDPVARTPAVAWEARVVRLIAAEHVPDEVLVDGSGRAPFAWLEDESGRARVALEGASLALPVRIEGQTNGILFASDPAPRRVVRAFELAEGPAYFVRYGALADGDRVEVAGVADAAEIDGRLELVIRGAPGGPRVRVRPHP